MQKKLSSIIIATHGYTPELKECLLSIKKNTQADYELIVVATGEPPQKYFKNLDVKLIKTKESGPAKKRNIAVKKAKGKYLIFLDSDTVVDKKWLSPVVGYLNKNPNVAGGQFKLLRYSDKNTYDSAGEKITPWGFLVERARRTKDKAQFDKAKKIFSGKGAALIFKKKVFEKAGGFDPDYFIYWEEPDIFWRIWKLGKEIKFLYMGSVWHKTKRTNQSAYKKKLGKITYYGCRNQLMTILKNSVCTNRIKMLIGVNLAWFLFLIFFTLNLKFERVKAIIQAYTWIINNYRSIKEKRKKYIRKIGETEFFSDHRWLPHVTQRRGIHWYLGKAIAYILNKPF